MMAETPRPCKACSLAPLPAGPDGDGLDTSLADCPTFSSVAECTGSHSDTMDQKACLNMDELFGNGPLRLAAACTGLVNALSSAGTLGQPHTLYAWLLLRHLHKLLPCCVVKCHTRASAAKGSMLTRIRHTIIGPLQCLEIQLIPCPRT